MSMRDKTNPEQAQLMFACSQCLEPVGQWCMTLSGRPTEQLHRARQDAVLRVAEMSGFFDEISELRRMLRVERLVDGRRRS